MFHWWGNERGLWGISPTTLYVKNGLHDGLLCMMHRCARSTEYYKEKYSLTKKSIHFMQKFYHGPIKINCQALDVKTVCLWHRISEIFDTMPSQKSVYYFQ